MLNKTLYLAKDIFSKKVERIPTRNGFGEGLKQAGQENEKVVALCADLTESTRFHEFRNAYPDRFFQVGAAEQNMAGVAAGLALSGKIPFIGSYATFSPGRNWDQLRVSVCYNNIDVKIIGAHAGVSVGPDGATHQALEDIAITRVLPNLTVIIPCDYHQSRLATLATAKYKGPVYLRLAREKTAVMTSKETPFEIGRAEIYYDSGNDLTIVGAGPILYECLLAAEKLTKKKIGVKVVNLHTIKPIDEKTLVNLAKQTKAVLVAEEHQKFAGVFSAVSEVLVKKYPVPMEQVAMDDRFGESGGSDELLNYFGLTSPFIIKAAEKLLKRK